MNSIISQCTPVTVATECPGETPANTVDNGNVGHGETHAPSAPGIPHLTGRQQNQSGDSSGAGRYAHLSGPQLMGVIAKAKAALGDPLEAHSLPLNEHQYFSRDQLEHMYMQGHRHGAMSLMTAALVVQSHENMRARLRAVEKERDKERREKDQWREAYSVAAEVIR
jgi:hypothetical protein